MRPGGRTSLFLELSRRELTLCPTTGYGNVESVSKEAIVRALVFLFVCVLVGCTPVFGQTIELGNVFQGQGFGYLIRYPSDWIYQNPSPYTVVFSGARGTPAYYSTVTIQNLASTALGGKYASVDDVLSEFKCELASGSEEIRIYDPKLWTWTLSDGRKLAGKGFTAEFTRQGTSYRAWEVVFPHPNGNVFCTFAYTSSPEEFATYLPIAQAMFESWTFLEGATSSGAPATPPSGTAGPSTGTATASGIRVLFEASGHIYQLAGTETEFNLGKQDKRTYTVTIPSAGYLSCALVDEAGQWIGVWYVDPSGKKAEGRAGTQASIYGGIYPVEAGTYTVVVGPMKAFDDSEFALQVYFSTTPFTLQDLIAAFGDQYRTLK